MSTIWRALEEMPDGVGVAAEWQADAGAAWPAFKAAFLEALPEPAASVPCPHECGCAHRVVRHDDGRLAGACECDPWNCDDIALSATDVVAWEFNRTRLGRALCKAFDLDRREEELGLRWTRQAGAFSAGAVPVVVTIPQEHGELRQVVGDLAVRWREGFILFAPTSRWVDGRAHELLAHARAKFFDLESHVRLLPNGVLQAQRSAGELFSALVAKGSHGASDDEARRLFALLKALESEGDYRKAPVTRVFQLYCLEGLTREEVATKCRCAPSLVTLRLQAIEARVGRKASELRQLSGQFERIADSLTDTRARRVHRESALDEPDGEGEEERF